MKMQELSRAQQSYFKNSKARDENGDLLIVQVATKYDKDGTLLYKPTTYTNLDDLSLDGGFKAVPMYVNAINPFDYGENQLNEYRQKNECKSMREVVECLRRDGYDSMMASNKQGDKEIIIFEPNQIKYIDNRFPTKSDFSMDNSQEYYQANFRNLTLAEHMEFAKMSKGPVERNVRNGIERQDQNR